MWKKNDKDLYEKNTINTINLDEVDKILNDYITTQNKKTVLYFLKCQFKKEFDKMFHNNYSNSLFF